MSNANSNSNYLGMINQTSNNNAITNIENNKIIELLEKIGRTNKSFSNRVKTALTPGSKSRDYLNILESKIQNFKVKMITQNNFERLKNLVKYINDFITKISSKNNRDLENRAFGLANDIRKLFTAFSYYITKKSKEDTTNRNAFIKLVELQKSLLKLYYDTYTYKKNHSNNNNIQYINKSAPDLQKIKNFLKEMQTEFNTKFPEENKGLRLRNNNNRRL